MSLPSPINEHAGAGAAVEIAGDVQRTLARYMEWTVREWRRLLDELDRKQAGYVAPGERDDLAQLREFTRSALDSFERLGRERPPRLDETPPASLDWTDITNELRRDNEAGMALWGTVKQTARDELAIGKTGAEAVEPYDHRPWDRARYFALREALADGLQPRNGMEWVLIDGMAEAWTMHLYWLGKHVKTASLDAIRLERDMRQREGWEPPRLGEAEAVDRAAQMADRFQRQFLRLMKCYRDGRRLIASMTVLGGQVNVAEQQINVAAQASRTED